MNRTGPWFVFAVVTLLALLEGRNGLPARPVQRGTPADRVTFVRACLCCLVAALVVLGYAGRPHVVVLVSLASVALALDAVDGWVARRTRSTAFGAAFDMEVDAFLVLVLSAAVAVTVGWWVLLIGSARYLLLLATRPWPWLADPIPPRRWAKGVAALQGIVLVVVAADALPIRVAELLLAVALLLLAVSFGHQVWWLRTHRATTGDRACRDHVTSDQRSRQARPSGARLRGEAR